MRFSLVTRARRTEEFDEDHQPAGESHETHLEVADALTRIAPERRAVVVMRIVVGFTPRRPPRPSDRRRDRPLAAASRARRPAVALEVPSRERRRIEDRVRDAFASAGPSDELVASAAAGPSPAAASASARAAAARGGRRRVLASIAVAGAVLGAGVATASVVLDQRNPTVPASPGTRAAIGESGILASAPGCSRPEGAP